MCSQKSRDLKNVNEKAIVRSGRNKECVEYRKCHRMYEHQNNSC